MHRVYKFVFWVLRTFFSIVGAAVLVSLAFVLTGGHFLGFFFYGS